MFSCTRNLCIVVMYENSAKNNAVAPWTGMIGKFGCVVLICCWGMQRTHAMTCMQTATQMIVGADIQIWSLYLWFGPHSNSDTYGRHHKCSSDHTVKSHNANQSLQKSWGFQQWQRTATSIKQLRQASLRTLPVSARKSTRWWLMPTSSCTMAWRHHPYSFWCTVRAQQIIFSGKNNSVFQHRLAASTQTMTIIYIYIYIYV